MSLSTFQKQVNNCLHYTNNKQLKTFKGNLTLLLFAFIHCALLVSIYTSGIISNIVADKSFGSFEQRDLMNALESGRHRLVIPDQFHVSALCYLVIFV